MESRQNSNPFEDLVGLIGSQPLPSIQLVYERWSDTLLVNLLPHEGPSVSSPMSNGWMIRLDRATRKPFGLHIENAFYLAQTEMPSLMDVILLAEQTDAEPLELKLKQRAGDFETGEEALESWIEHLPDLIAL